MLANIQPGDEIICPSYTFVSTALAFVRQGAKIVFADSMNDNPNIDSDKIAPLITPQTKAVIVVHYGGIACDMDKIMAIANRHNLLVFEDAAQAIDSYYKGKALGSIGHLSAFSFHETKNIISGEGGLLAINSEKFIPRAEILWEKGTNRSQFFRGEINKYEWVDIGSSFLPSEIIAAFLWAQLENLEDIQRHRLEIWTLYHQSLKHLEAEGKIRLAHIPEYSTNNAHLFYLICKSQDERSQLIVYLKNNGIQAVFHYLSLHSSSYYKDKHDGRVLKECNRFSDCLVRLPIYYDLTQVDVLHICSLIESFYKA
jgi:dTDP-4-amino-4,6-dideoxygalactose transaminase